MFKLEILTHWIVPQQGKNHSEIDEEPNFLFCPSSFSFRLLGGSRLRVSAMDIHTYVKVKLLLSPRQSRGFTCFNYLALG
jgi:hypothetical protein